MSDDDVELELFRRELLGLRGQASDFVDYVLRVVAVLDAALADLGRPVIVGGMAVWFWTDRPEFHTADVDLVVSLPARGYERVERLGFARTTDLRHFEHPELGLHIEFPESSLDPGARTYGVVTGPGREALVLSLEDATVVRLQEFQAPGHHPAVGDQVVALLQRAIEAGALNDVAARAAAATPRVVHTMRALESVAIGVAARTRPLPEPDEYADIGRQGLLADLGLSES